MIVQQGSFPSKLAVEFGSVPADAAEILARMERARRNSQWLQAHWPDLLPRAAGKYVAVAAEEAFIAESPEEAWAWARRAHPEDDTATVEYVNADKIRKVISEEIPAKVAADKQNARIEHDNALRRIMNEILADHTELYKQFSDNENFRKWLADMVFELTFEDEDARP